MTLDKNVKVSLGAVVAAVLVAIGVMQPIVGSLMQTLVADTRFKTSVEGRLNSHDKTLDELKPDVKRIAEATYRIEAKLGTLPAGAAAPGTPGTHGSP